MLFREKKTTSYEDAGNTLFESARARNYVPVRTSGPESAQAKPPCACDWNGEAKKNTTTT